MSANQLDDSALVDFMRIMSLCVTLRHKSHESYDDESDVMAPLDSSISNNSKEFGMCTAYTVRALVAHDFIKCLY